MKKIIFILLFTLCSCGSAVVSKKNNSPGGPDINISSSQSVFFLATDFASSALLYSTLLDLSGSFDLTSLNNLGSSAIIRYFENQLFILHDGFSFFSTDNLQIVNPENNFETINQWSTGNGTNPKDVIVVGNYAFISLYNPGDDDGDIIVMNISNGQIEKNIKVTDFLNNDAFKKAYADCMIQIENKIYVCLQDLEQDFSPNTFGKLAVIDVETFELLEVIILKGYNPMSLAFSSTENKLFVAHSAGYGNFDILENHFGGLEIISLDDFNSSVLIEDDNLGGYVEKVVVSDNSVFVVVSNFETDPVLIFLSSILKMDVTNTQADGLSEFITNNADIRALLVDSNNTLWVSRRTIEVGNGQTSDAKVEAIDSQTGEILLGPLFPQVPVTSMAYTSQF